MSQTENPINCRLQMGDRVTNNKLSKPILGTVDGIHPAYFYNKNTKWECTYPDWKDKYVIYVKLDVPDKENNSYLVFPEDDLIKLDEIGVD